MLLRREAAAETTREPVLKPRAASLLHWAVLMDGRLTEHGSGLAEVVAARLPHF
jgi:hypothetical protein